MTQTARDVIEREAENWFRVHSDTDFEFLGDAIIAALAAAGYAIVPIEPIEEMKAIVMPDIRSWWKAMLKAAQEEK